MAFDGSPSVPFDKLDRHAGRDPVLEVEFRHDQLDYKLGLEKSAAAYFEKKLTRASDGVATSYKTFAQGEYPLIAYVPSRRPWADTYNPAAQVSIRQLDVPLQRRQNQLEGLGDQLNQIIQSKTKQKFDEMLRSVLPDLKDWSTDRIAGQDRIICITSNGTEHAIGDVGDGVVSVFRICFALHGYPDDVPIVLDEPELSLHPDGQKRLYRLVREKSRVRQIILATHSPHFVDWQDLVAGVRLYRIAQNSNGHSLPFAPTQKTLHSVSRVATKDRINRRLFDYLSKEIFFQSATVFLEGPEDVHIFMNYLEGSDADLPLFSYGAGGAGNIRLWLMLSLELGLRAAAVYDRDKADDYRDASMVFSSEPSILIILSEKDDIRDKFLTTGQEKTGFFDDKWQLKEHERASFEAMVKKVKDHIEGSAEVHTRIPAANVLNIESARKK